jgi:hypothetical protein
MNENVPRLNRKKQKKYTSFSNAGDADALT